MQYFLLILGIIFGFIGGMQYVLWIRKIQNDRLRKKTEDLFIKIAYGNLTFKYRIHNTVYFSTQEKNYTFIYFLDKKEMAIFEKSTDGTDVCIALSFSINKELSNRIINKIDNNFNYEINTDVININGQIISRSYFNNLSNFNQTKTEQSEIDLIKKLNNDKLSLDDILDKILKSGRQSLTEQEIEFLHNISK